jgi:hypothetical protein
LPPIHNCVRGLLRGSSDQLQCDPQRRASYDNEHRKARRTPAPEPFEAPKPVPTIQDEVQRRDEILLLLYRRRQTHPQQPHIGLRDLETLLGIPKEQLEFSLWYLKESGHIVRSDSARHTITLQGVQLAESLNRRVSDAPRIDATHVG